MARRPLQSVVSSLALPLAVAVMTAVAPSSFAQQFYDSFYFTSESTNFMCEGMGFECAPPGVCAHDRLLDKYYCCEHGEGSVCWNGSTCNGGNETTPGANQFSCPGNYCCLSQRESCTQRTSQINICWAVQPNPFTNITEARINESYSSLSSASPAASTYAFDLSSLYAIETATATAVVTNAVTSSESPTLTSPGSPTPTPLQQPYSNSPRGFAIGAIVGITIGAVALAAIIGASIWYCIKKRKTAAAGTAAATAGGSSPNVPANVGDGPRPPGWVAEGYYAPQQAPHSNTLSPSEMTGTPSTWSRHTQGFAQELPADYRGNHR